MSRFRVDKAAPLPLGYQQALERAVELRALGDLWTWHVIANVMRVYHGFDRGADWWREELRGRVEAKPRGNAFNGKQAA